MPWNEQDISEALALFEEVQSDTKLTESNESGIK